MNDFIELRRVSSIILRRWWWLALLTVLGALAGYLFSRQQTPVYQATTTILVGDSIRSTNVDRVDIQVSEALVQTYVEVAQRQPVLQGVVTALDLNGSWQALSRQIQVTQIESTQLIQIVVEASSPEMARRIADEIVNQLILLSPTNSEGSDNEFNREQLTSLQERIVTGQNRLLEIEDAMSKSISEIELADLQREKSTLNGLLVEWERNYADMLLVTEPKRNPTQLSVIESAHSNNNQIRPRVQLNTLLGGVLGMIIGLGLIFLLDFLDDTYKSLNDFSQSEEVNILGSIRKIKGRKLGDKLVALKQPHSPATESYRIIRSRIRFKPTDKLTRSIMVTSSMPEEGKSITAANLAVVFAQANYKTVIVDADLRHPSLHEVFEVNNEVGLGDLLSSTDVKIQDCLQDTAANNLKILTSGMPLLDPSERLGSDRMKDILDELKSVASVVIVDSPPVLIYADAIALSARLDGVILVIQAGKSTRGAIAQALFDLQNANANLLGSVFNQSPKSDSFSVNKAYMQERPRLSAPTALTRKAKAHAGPFEDLRESAVPLNEKLEEPGLVSEATTMDEVQSGSIDNDELSELNSLDAANDNGLEPEHKMEIAELDSLDVTPDEISGVSMRDSLEQEDGIAEFQGIENNTETIDQSHEETMLEAGNGAVHEHQVEVVEEHNLESETEVNEQLSGFQENAESRDKTSRKRRSRKNKVNGSKNEEVAGNLIHVPGVNETHDHVEMDQISEPVDHDVVLIDQDKDE